MSCSELLGAAPKALLASMALTPGRTWGLGRWGKGRKKRRPLGAMEVGGGGGGGGVRKVVGIVGS